MKLNALNPESVFGTTSMSDKHVKSQKTLNEDQLLLEGRTVRILGGTSMVSLRTVAIVILDSRRRRSTGECLVQVKSE